MTVWSHLVNLKGLEKKWCWHISWAYPGNHLEGLRIIVPAKI